MAYTNQKQIRAAFWAECGARPGISRRRITAHDGVGKMYNTNTRVAFVDFIDRLHRAGEISSVLAARVTLDPPERQRRHRDRWSRPA